MSNQSKWNDILRALAETAEPTDAKAKTRARLIRAATRLFASQGYKRTSMEDVAREAHVAKGTVYVHFKNKQDLLMEAISDEKKRYAALFLPLFKEELAPEVRLRRYLELGFTSIRSAPLVAKLLSGDREIFAVLDDLGPEFRDQLERGQQAGMAMLLQGVGQFDSLSAEEQAARVKTLVGLMYASPVFMDDRLVGELSPERYAQALARTIVQGIGAP